jgi:RNA polymerase-binding transcription factor DksA
MGKQIDTLVPRNLAMLQRRQAALQKLLREPAKDDDNERSFEERELQSVILAIQRIQEGTYGFCADCTRGIAVARLQALPNTERCIECQREHERTEVFGVLPQELRFETEEQD